MRHRILLVALIVLTGLAGYIVGYAQTQQWVGKPVVYAGDDFGFKVSGRVGDISQDGKGWVAGTFVVKIDGRWVEARLGAKTMPVK